MTLVIRYLRELFSAVATSWNRFWFSPVDPATLGLVRILAGAMLLYTHLVWTIDLDAFFGQHSWISPEAANSWLRGGSSWSWFWIIHSRAVLWTVHCAALVVFALFTLGLWSRVTSVLAFIAAIAYVNRVPGALFGLDQINCMLALYVMVGPSGDAYSLDRWRAARRAGQVLPPAAPSVGANLSTRLIQVHMCVIYFFAGLAKMQGGSWWAGSALWGAFANLEYQSYDMTWLAHWPLAVAVMSQVTVWWELWFSVIVWPRILRPLVLAISIPLHLGIGLFLGMMTFGLVMLIGCASFLPPEWVRAIIDRRSQQGRGGQGGAASEAATGTSTPRRRQPPTPASGRRR